MTAQDAHQAAALSNSCHLVTTYQETGFLSLLTRDPERARWFAADKLGPLWDADPMMAELRTTLLSYLQNGASLTKTASELFVHRNTVVHRLQRIKKILGCDEIPVQGDILAALFLAASLKPDGSGRRPGVRARSKSKNEQTAVTIGKVHR